MTLLLSYLSLALGVSFLCSLTESVILSISRAQVASIVKSGKSCGPTLQKMKADINRPLAAILTLNTVAHTVGSTGVGAQAFHLWQDRGVAIASGVLTLLILLFSEIIPKTLGAVHAKRLAGPTTRTIQGMIVVTYPLVLLSQVIARLISGRGGQHRLTREDLALLAEMGQAEGALEEKEYRVIRNLLRMNEIRVSEVMTPRNVVFMLSKDSTIREVSGRLSAFRFSRIPIHEDNPDKIVGMVLRNELYEAVRTNQQDRRLDQIVHPIHAIPESATVAQALNEFIQRREHIFQVVDEYGGTAGVVTLEDAVETLLGAEIVDETDSVEDMRQLAARLFRGRAAASQFDKGRTQR